MWFKIAFGVAFLFAVTIAARTATLAGKTHGGTMNHLSHEVRGLLAVRAALGIVFYGSLVAWIFWPRSLSWMYLAIPNALRWTAVALLIPTLVLFATSFSALGASYRGGVGLYPNHVLVTTGPYRLIRHPIYLAFIAIMCLVFVLSANWLLGLSGLLLVSSIAIARIPVEERELRERFGMSWRAYQAQTGRMFPRVWR
jgi:protein-S-isoprenylcysteine O-methyltransferase Ste14